MTIQDAIQNLDFGNYLELAKQAGYEFTNPDDYSISSVTETYYDVYLWFIDDDDDNDMILLRITIVNGAPAAEVL